MFDMCGGGVSRSIAIVFSTQELAAKVFVAKVFAAQVFAAQVFAAQVFAAQVSAAQVFDEIGFSAQMFAT